MSSDYYSPEFKMIAREQDRLQAITENLANASMPGFKRICVGDLTFDTVLQQSVEFYTDQMERGRYDPVFIDFTEGPLKLTDRPLDFAIQGDAFFAVQRNGEELYTRNGHFKIGTDGVLQNMDGFPVQGENGNITVPDNVNLSELIAGPDGTIRDGKNTELGKLKLVQFSDKRELGRAGTSLYNAPSHMPPQEVKEGTAQVVARTLEGSNTTMYDEMAELISCTRAYEANQRMVRSFDENETKMIGTLGA